MIGGIVCIHGNLTILKKNDRSLIYIKNRRGPRQEPCGIPQFILFIQFIFSKGRRGHCSRFFLFNIPCYIIHKEKKRLMTLFLT